MTGAIIGGVTATAVGEVSAGCNGSLAGQLAPSLSKTIPVGKYCKLVLTNKGSESVLGAVAGVIKERLDDEQANRPMREHVKNLRKQLVGNVVLDVGVGVLSATVGHITNQTLTLAIRMLTELIGGRIQKQILEAQGQPIP